MRLVTLHRWFGVSAALFLFVAGLTGCILAFKHELDPLLNPQLFHVHESGPDLSPDALAAAAQRHLPTARTTSVMLGREQGYSATVYLEPVAGLSSEEAAAVPYVMFLHPETGALLGARRSPAPLDSVHLFDWLLELHYSLMLPARIGIFLFGILSIFWIFDNLIGILLAFPPGQPAAKAFQVKWQGKAYRINCDLHRVTGLLLLPVLLMLAISSVSLNLPEEVAEPVVGLLSDVSERGTLPPRSSPAPGSPPMDWSAAIARAEALVPSIYPDRIRLDSIDLDRESGTFRASYLTPQDVDPKTGRSRFHFDAWTGELIRIDPPQGTSAGDAFLAWMFPLHGGAAFGLLGRAIISFTGLAVAGLSVTGLVIWWKKRKGRTGRADRKNKVRQTQTPRQISLQTPE